MVINKSVIDEVESSLSLYFAQYKFGRKPLVPLFGRVLPEFGASKLALRGDWVATLRAT
jgi:hypothetical protein